MEKNKQGTAIIVRQAGYWLGVVLIGMVIGMTLRFSEAWFSPSGTPPNSDIGAPVTTGSVAQTRTGALTLSGALTANGTLTVNNTLIASKYATRSSWIPTNNESMNIAGSIAAWGSSDIFSWGRFRSSLDVWGNLNASGDLILTGNNKKIDLRNNNGMNLNRGNIDLAEGNINLTKGNINLTEGNINLDKDDADICVGQGSNRKCLSDMVPEPPVCQGAKKALQWKGNDGWECADIN